MIPGVSGRLELRGDGEVVARFAHELERASAAAHGSRGVVEHGGLRLYWKASPFRGKAVLRHALRGALLRQRAPRIAEFENLAWLREHELAAPRPVAAGVVRRLGAPVFQFLFTKEVNGGVRLDEVFAAEGAAMRAAVLQRLGYDVGRMHALGFVHRDLFARNLLVTLLEGAPVVYFLDAWRGGPGPGLRGPAYDLGCLMETGAGLFDDDEQRLLFESYAHGRERAGEPVELAPLLRAAGRQKRRLVERLARRGR